MNRQRFYKRNISHEIKKVKQVQGFENVDEEELMEYYYKFKEISGGEIFINLDQFQELLNSFGVNPFNLACEPGRGRHFRSLASERD